MIVSLIIGRKEVGLEMHQYKTMLMTYSVSKKTLTTWKGPLGKRRRGRPCKRWEDDVVKVAGVDWFQIAKSREDWLFLKEAFICRGLLAED